MAVKILIVEDDKDTLDIYKTALDEAGYDVDTATDGEASLIKVSKGGYDLILHDVMLPKRDGLSVLAELKEHPSKTANGPIYILSNLSHDKAISEAQRLGAAGFINKLDFNPDQLVAKVKEILKSIA
jgi:DNA-binding response OmpR family regulator